MTAFFASRIVERLVFVTGTFFASALAALANEEPPAPPNSTTYDLRYKLATGDVLRYDVKHRASFRTTIDKTTQEAQTKTDSVKLWKITDVLPNGDMEIVNVVDHVRMVHQLPEREPVDYDSREDKTPPPGFEDTARAIGVPLSVVRINAAGKVLRRDVKLQQQNVEEDTPIVVRLPDKPVTIGETWDDSFDVKVSLENGGTKTIQTRRRHKLAGVKSGIATIEVTYQVLSPIDPFIESQLVQRLMEGEVKFDIASGRVASQQMDIDKRILGFAGPTSSMHYVTRMEEKIVTAKPEVAVKQPAPKKAKPTARGAQNRTIRNSRSSGRSRVPQGAKGYRR
jgi:hypothetical protein